MLPMTVGLIPFGVVCGVGAISVGASPLAALAMSMIMFSGAAQIIATQLLAAGAPFAVIVLSCFVVSLRFLMYSAALAPYLKPVDSRWRNLIAFLLTDQAFAATIQRFRDRSDLRASISYFLGGGVVLWVAWQLATIVGILAGAIIPVSWQLEFVVPLCFIALLAPLLHDRVALIVFATAAVAAIALDAMPMRLSMICAGLAGIVAGVVADRLLGPQRERGGRALETSQLLIWGADRRVGAINFRGAPVVHRAVRAPRDAAAAGARTAPRAGGDADRDRRAGDRVRRAGRPAPRRRQRQAGRRAGRRHRRLALAQHGC